MKGRWVHASLVAECLTQVTGQTGEPQVQICCTHMAAAETHIIQKKEIKKEEVLGRGLRKPLLNAQ